MRRTRGLLLLAITVTALTACGAQAPVSMAPTTSPAGVTATTGAGPTTPTATPGATVDAAVNAQVCGVANAAVAGAVKFFAEQMAALERAAAKGDQDGVVAAATAIQDRLTALGAAFSGYAAMAVTPQLRAVLVDTATAVSEISSPSYPGTTADIKKTLAELSAAFKSACG